MADTYTSPQKLTTIQAGELGTTIVTPQQPSVNFGISTFENAQSITSNYCITTGSGAFSAGPITINAIVTIPDGSSWVIR
jgi:hypothetical protein